MPEIIYPVDLFPFENREYQAVIEKFVAHMEQYLGVKAYRLDLSNRWDASQYGDGRHLPDYLDTKIPSIQLRDCYNNSETFRRSYSDRFQKRPFVDLVIRYKWDLSHTISDEHNKGGLKERRSRIGCRERLCRRARSL